MADLKPCPFCGSTNIESEADAGMQFYCTDCGGSGGVHDEESEAIALWNNRPEPDVAPHSASANKAIRKLLGELVAYVGDLERQLNAVLAQLPE